MSDTSKPKKNTKRIVHITAHTVIASLYHFLTEEYLFLKSNNDENCDLSYLSDIKKRTAEATGVSEETVESILEEERQNKEKLKPAKSTADYQTWPLPTPNRKRVPDFILEREGSKVWKIHNSGHGCQAKSSEN